ncbi:MAG: histidine kinase [Desulfobacterales bacterium]|nr:histidine kinase [Desulfobacterales bacterium]MDD4073090.1 histidine kinase [Desulfobacterales bacterium]MDD4393490.1 histidine kinase [Desulfobacterales bacterium]
MNDMAHIINSLPVAAIFHASPVGIEIYDAECRLMDANPAALQLFGITDAAAMARVSLSEKMGIRKEQLRPLQFGKSIRFEHIYDFEKNRNRHLFPTSKTGIVHLDIWMMPLNKDGSRLPQGYLVQYQDISEGKRSEAQFYNVTRRLFKVQETERQNISLYLHDSLAQDLSTLKIGMDLMHGEHTQIPADIRQKIAAISSRLQQTIQEVRDLSYNLHPSILDNLGLVPGIQQLCMNFSDKTGIHLNFFSAGFEGITLDFEMNIHLYRMVQEALDLIRTQSKATQAIIKIVASYPNVLIRIEDDGNMINVNESPTDERNGKQMRGHSLSERIRLLNGTIKFNSCRAKGNRIFMEVPYNEKVHSEQCLAHPIRHGAMEQIKMFR